MSSICRRPAIRLTALQGLSYWGNPQSTRLQFFCELNASPDIFAKPLSSLATKDDSDESLFVSFLMNSCGFSLESANSLLTDRYGTRLSGTRLEKAQRVIGILKDHGFSAAHIPKLIPSWTKVLASRDLENILVSKLEFFYSIGFTKQDLPHFLSKNPSFWYRNLQGHTLPLYTTMKSILKSDKEVVAAMKRLGWAMWVSGKNNLDLNVAFLGKIGVPHSVVALHLKTYPADMLLENSKFCQIVNQVKDYGFDMSKSVFCLALHTMCHRYTATRDHCREIYKKWGWSDDDILLAFKKNPLCLVVSKDKLTRTLDFLMNRMGFQVDALAKYPFAVRFNLDRRIIPRCSVIELLVKKGLMERRLTLSSVLICKESSFLEKYVNKYQDIAPELLKVYRGSLSTSSGNRS